jgi:hypothetical protein
LVSRRRVAEWGGLVANATSAEANRQAANALERQSQPLDDVVGAHARTTAAHNLCARRSNSEPEREVT